jgi:hypothetical protein
MPHERPQHGQGFRPGEQHPDEWRRDLNPDAMAGQNLGVHGPGPNTDLERARTAYDVKELHRRFHDMDDDILKAIPVLPPGVRLEQGATYLDLAAEQPREFTAGGNMTSGPENCFVPKNKTDYNIWNRLAGVRDPERLGLGSEPE